MFKVLLVDDERLSREMLSTYLEGLLGLNVTQAENGDEALQKIESDFFQIIISDIKMPGMNGHELLRHIKKHPKAKKSFVVLVTGFAEIDSAVQALRDGAYDYLFKPIDVNRLTELIEEIKQIIASGEDVEVSTSRASVTAEVELAPTTNMKKGSFIVLPDGGKFGIFSSEMKNIINISSKFHKDRSIPVLIEGESGTGKEMIASYIHYGEEGTKEPLISVNCSSFTETLFESEFFGYVTGAFTGSKEGGRDGKLKMADGGTLFLDEIGDMPLEMQPKLLRVIQEKSFYPIGGNQSINIDIRIIAATNRDLKKMVKEGKFRQDLYFRLNTGLIKLPRLAEHIESVTPLAQMFLIDISQSKEKKFRLISKEAINILENHTWPGNIRELKNVIERVVLIHDGFELRPEHLDFIDSDFTLLENQGIPTLNPGAFRLPDTNFEITKLDKQIVLQALEKFKGNKTKTAEYLGLTLSALRSRMK